MSRVIETVSFSVCDAVLGEAQARPARPFDVGCAMRGPPGGGPRYREKHPALGGEARSRRDRRARTDGMHCSAPERAQGGAEALPPARSERLADIAFSLVRRARAPRGGYRAGSTRSGATVGQSPSLFGKEVTSSGERLSRRGVSQRGGSARRRARGREEASHQVARFERMAPPRPPMANGARGRGDRPAVTVGLSAPLCVRQALRDGVAAMSQTSTHAA